MAQETTKVCVTGSEGYLGSNLVMALLSKGYYTVHATVQDISKAQFLFGHPNAHRLLKLFKADLMAEGSFDPAMPGCQGVFHLASPTTLTWQDPQKEVIDCAVQGTLNVLKSCQKAGTVQRVVHMSSMSAALSYEKYLRKDPDAMVDKSCWTCAEVDESCWTCAEVAQAQHPVSWPYRVSKTVAEKAALEYGKEKGMEVVSILPPLTCGWPWPSTEYPPASIHAVMSPFTANRGFTMLEPCPPGFVHVEDVTDAQILLMESPNANGRYLCCAANTSLPDLLGFLGTRYPQHGLQYPLSHGMDNGSVRVSTNKLMKLGFTYTHDLASMFDDTIQQYVSSGHLSSFTR